VWDRAKAKRQRIAASPLRFTQGLIQLKLNDKNVINKKSARRN
jgi:hypothetical protein